MNKIATVDEYIAHAPADKREKLKQVRQIIKEIAPAETIEKLSYSMPYYGYKGRLAYFGYATNHIGLYLMPPVLEAHKDDLKGYVTAKSAIQFPLDKKLPVQLIKKLIRSGVENNERKSQSKI